MPTIRDFMPPDAPVDPPAVALYVPHRATEKMCGRVCQVEGTWVLYHESNGTQYHFLTDSIGGVDVAVLNWLDVYGMTQIHHEITTAVVGRRGVAAAGVYVATVAQLRVAPLRTWDDRERHFLRTEEWEYRGPRTYTVPTRLRKVSLL